MKILHVCPLYYPSLGGNEIHVQVLSEKLAQAGHEVHIFTANASDRHQLLDLKAKGKPLPSFEMINGVHVHRFEVQPRRQEFLTNRFLRIRGACRFTQTFFKDDFEYWKVGPFVKGMLKAIGQLKPDLMLAVMENSYTTFLCYRGKVKYGIPFILMPITHIVDTRSFRKVLPKIYSAADKIIACTPFEKDQLIKWGVDDSKISVLPLGLRPELMDGHDAKKARMKYQFKEELMVAYIGRIEHHKGVEVLIEAMKIIWNKFPKVQLLLAGKTAAHFHSTIKEEIKTLSVQQRENVVEIGRFEDEDKKHLFSAVDIIVMASNIDCFGLVYLEAWSCGKPVIACKNTPQETIIDDGRNGLLVEFDNPKELAVAIETLLKDQNLREQMGIHGKNKCLQVYNLNHYARNMEEFYQGFLDGRRS